MHCRPLCGIHRVCERRCAQADEKKEAEAKKLAAQIAALKSSLHSSPAAAPKPFTTKSFEATNKAATKAKQAAFMKQVRA